MGRKRKLIEKLPGSGIEVRFEEDWLKEAPSCYHGPMLLFDKYVEGKKVDSFYACSASRDGKHCCVKNQVPPEAKKPKKDSMLVKGNVGDSVLVTYNQISSLSPPNRTFCLRCQSFILNRATCQHEEECWKRNITDASLLEPSKKFLAPKEDTKVNAQYLLSEDTVTFLYSTLARLGVTDVVCLGMPRLHEHIQVCRSKFCEDKIMDSMLVDIDERFRMFWPQEKFVHFNMFNRHFFTGKDSLSFENYLQRSSSQNNKLAVVLDPPFGGLVDCIVETLKWLEVYVTAQREDRDSSDSTSVFSFMLFWIFPYFMEKRIKERMPFISMLDFQIDYDNHKKFKNAESGRKASPVRIFTNVDNERIVLPQNRYRFCESCRRYVTHENKHCAICNVCPSKDGRRYKHCNKCKKCVKPGRIHCKSCNRCEIAGHNCRLVDTSGCHLCGDKTHKRRECPARNCLNNQLHNKDIN